jgi:hypothetical protein
MTTKYRIGLNRIKKKLKEFKLSNDMVVMNQQINEKHDLLMVTNSIINDIKPKDCVNELYKWDGTSCFMDSVMILLTFYPPPYIQSKIDNDPLYLDDNNNIKENHKTKKNIRDEIRILQQSIISKKENIECRNVMKTFKQCANLKSYLSGYGIAAINYFQKREY